MADDTPREDPLPEPDEAAAPDGDPEPGAAEDAEAEAAPDTGEPTTRDLLVKAEEALAEMVIAIDDGKTADVDMDGLLDSAHAALTSLLSGELCPMCQGDGVLAAEPPADPRAERCNECKGRGKVYTGSLVPESAVRPCGKCGGKGFTDVAVITPLPTPDYAPPPPPTGAQWYDPDDAGTWHLPIDPAKRGLALS